MLARTTTSSTILAVCAAFVFGCGASMPAKQGGGGGTTPATAHGYGHGGGHGQGAPAAADSAASSSGGYSHQPQPEERPGLGTVWGETVVSHVRTKPFERATSSPFARVAIHYNDAEGVAAHANYVSGAGPQPITARTSGGGLTISLTDAYGNILPGAHANGRTFVVGRAGDRYNLAITNSTGGRFEVVASVDGLDVVDGQPANTDKRGYIIEPHSTLTIDGFRQSDSSVAAFRFGSVASSYAARTSGDRNVGVVGIAFFAERGSEWTTDELHRRDTADPFPGNHGYAKPPGY